MSYAGSYLDIQRYCRQIPVGGAALDVLSAEDVADYASGVDTIIDATLGQQYEVPLVQITRGVTRKYPDPIVEIAQKICAGYIVRAAYTEIEPNLSAAGISILDEGKNELNKLVNSIATGEIRLQGQRQKARNRFCRPTIHPAPIPAGPGPAAPGI